MTSRLIGWACLAAGLVVGGVESPPSHTPAEPFQGNSQNQGPANFRVVSSGSSFGVSASGIPDLPAYARSAMTGGTLIAYQTLDKKCPRGTKRQGKNHYNVYVLYIDENDGANQFETNMTAKTAKLTLRGVMQRWEPGPGFCEDGGLVEAARGPGAATISMTTAYHLTPRNFVAMTGTGTIEGAGLSDTLRNVPSPAPAPIGTSVALEEYMSGGQIPNVPQGVNIDATKPLLTLSLAGTKMLGRQPELVVHMAPSSAAETLGLTIHKPGVLGGDVIPEAKEDTPGAMTFVNLDNDDKDSEFDNATPEREVEGDDELVKVTLKLQPRRSPGGGMGRARLSVISGSENIKIWQAASKGTRFDPDRALEVPGDFKADGAFLRKDLWVEGVAPHTVARGTRLRFVYSEIPDFKDEASITVVGIEKIELKGDDNSDSDDENLKPDPNFHVPNAAFTTNPSASQFIPLKGIEAVRVFPGSRMVGGKVEERNRNRVKVVATLTVDPPEMIRLFFDSYDVDDPTSPSAPLDDESKEDDNRGEVKGAARPKTGRFAGELPDGTVPVDFTNRSRTFFFETTMQPGDNFRIVGNGDKDFLLQLENKESALSSNSGGINENKQRIVDPYVLAGAPANPPAAEIREESRYASKVLTVWRRMYIELDGMAPVQRNKVEGTIMKVWPNDPSPGFSRVRLDKNICSVLGIDIEGMADSFESGELKCGSGSLPVMSNTANWWYEDEVVVRGIVSTQMTGMFFVLTDDDAKHQFPENAPLPMPDTRTVDKRWAPAYVIPDFTTLEATNKTKVAPFVRHVKGLEASDLRPDYRFDHVAYEASETFWTGYLLAAFQANGKSDGDPGGEFCCGAIVDDLQDGQGAHVFFEGINELSGRDNGGIRVLTNEFGTGEQDCIAHELAHLLGAEHKDGKIMDLEGREFTEKSLAKMRSRKNP